MLACHLQRGVVLPSCIGESGIYDPLVSSILINAQTLPLTSVILSCIECHPWEIPNEMEVVIPLMLVILVQ